MVPPPKRIVETSSALVGIWGSTYLAFLDELGIELAALSDALEWPFLIIGACGTGSVLLSSWKDNRRGRFRKSREMTRWS
jgi:hypothetical protein